MLNRLATLPRAVQGMRSLFPRPSRHAAARPMSVTAPKAIGATAARCAKFCLSHSISALATGHATDIRALTFCRLESGSHQVQQRGAILAPPRLLHLVVLRRFTSSDD